MAMLTVSLVQCSKEDSTDKQMLNALDNQKILTVSEAKDFLEGIGLQGMSTKSTEEDIPNENGYVKYVPGDYTADWNKATDGEESGLGCVEIPVSTKNNYMALSYYTEADSTIFYYLRIMQKLIVVKSKDSDVKSAYLLSLIPDIEYATGKTCTEVLDSFTNIGEKGDYSGLVLYTVPNTGELVRVSQYENGEYCNGVYVFDKSSDIETNNDLAFRFLEKISIYRMANSVYTKSYEPIYDMPELVVTAERPNNRHKETADQLLSALIDRGGGGGSYENNTDPKPAGGGGGKTPTTKDDKNTAPNSKKIFKNSELSDSQWTILEAKIKEIMKQCMGMSLINTLAEKLGNKRITIEFNESIPGRFAFDGNSTTLFFNPDKDAFYLFHEMFHMYQAYGEININTYKAANLNLEFEAYFAVLRYMESDINLFNSMAYEKFIGHPIGASVDKLSRYLDDHGNLMPGKSVTEYENHISSKMVYTFRNYSDGVYNEERYKFDASRIGDMNFKNFRAVTKDC